MLTEWPLECNSRLRCKLCSIFRAPISERQVVDCFTVYYSKRPLQYASTMASVQKPSHFLFRICQPKYVKGHYKIDIHLCTCCTVNFNVPPNDVSKIGVRQEIA
jgi:hypothetical protein